MAASISSQIDSQIRNQKPPKLSNRAGDNDANEDTEEQNRNDSQYLPNPRKRLRGLPSTTIDIKASPATFNGRLSKPKQKPGPKPGFKFPTEAESPPPWIWDVTGTWTLACRKLADALKLQNSDSMIMSIHLANNPRHTKVGRQYWATLNFGDRSFVGNMRFCPHVDSSIRDDVDIEDFEKACVLKKGVWVGPPPDGMQKWNLRWRGVDLNTGDVEGCQSDQFQTDIEFGKGDDGNLTLTAVIVFRYQLMVLRGVKTGEVKPQGGNSVSIVRQWLRYKARYV